MKNKVGRQLYERSPNWVNNCKMGECRLGELLYEGQVTSVFPFCLVLSRDTCSSFEDVVVQYYNIYWLVWISFGM